MGYTVGVQQSLRAALARGEPLSIPWIARLAGGVGLLGLAALLTFLPLRTALLLSVAAGGGLLLLVRPWLVWVALWAALPFAAAINIGPASGLDLLLAAAVGLWFVDGVRRDSLRLAWTAPLAATVPFLIVLLFSSLRALDFAQALVEVIKWAEFALILALLPVMVRGSVKDGDRVGSGSRVRWVVLGLVAGATAQALLGLYQFVFQVGPEWFIILGRFMRASGSFAQPNPFAGYLGLVLPVAVSLAIWSWGEVGRSRAASDVARSARWAPLLWAITWSTGAAIIAAGLLASWSRGGWLGAAAGLATVLLLRSRRAAIVGAIVALILTFAALVGILSPVTVQERVPESVRVRLAEIPAFFGGGDILAQEITDENFALVERVAHWVAAQRMFQAAPWLGVGAGSYAAAYPAYRVPVWEEALGHAHNAYLNTLAEVGLLGTAAFALIWLTLVVWLWKALRSARRDAMGPAVQASAARGQAALIIGAYGVLVHLAVHSLVDNLFVQGLYVILALWPALVAVTFAPQRADAHSTGMPL